jgi:hypothetical protein
MARLRATAAAVADGVAALQDLTLGPADELESPADVRDVLASLSQAMAQLPQRLGQLAVFVEIEHVKGAISGGPDAGAAGHVRAVSDVLHRAGRDAETMAAALAAAKEACASLRAVSAAGGRPPPDPPVGTARRLNPGPGPGLRRQSVPGARKMVKRRYSSPR